jgi:hypothetical protein
MNNNVWQDERPPYEEKKPWWNSRPLIIIAIAIVLVIGLSFLWQALSPDDGASNGEVPYVAAENEPEKVKPENVGGEEIPHQDKKIYELIDGSDGRVVRTVAAVENADHKIELPIGDAPSTFSDATSLTPEEEEPHTVYNIQSKVVNITEINDNDVIDNKTIKVGDAPDKKEKTPALPTNKHRVQVASLPSEKEAHAEIKILRGKYEALKGLKIGVVPAVVKGKTMYRIHTGPFDTAAAADNLCKSLQAAGGSCLLVKPSKG